MLSTLKIAKNTKSGNTQMLGKRNAKQVRQILLNFTMWLVTSPWSPFPDTYFHTQSLVVRRLSRLLTYLLSSINCVIRKHTALQAK